MSSISAFLWAAFWSVDDKEIKESAAQADGLPAIG